MPASTLQMPTLAPPARELAPHRASGDTDSTVLRLGRVVAVSVLFFGVFYALEHDAGAFAGSQIADVGEDRIADTYMDQVEGGSSIRRIVVPLYGLAGLACLYLARARAWNIRPATLVFLVGLLAWAAMSTLWSDEPGLARKRMVVAALIVTGSLGFARLLRPNELLLVALATFTAFVSLSWLIDVSAGGQPWSGDYRFSGTLNPTIQAAYCGMLCLAAFCQPAGFGQRWAPRLLFAGGLMAMLQTQSRTSVIALALGAAMAWMIRLDGRLRYLAASLLVSGVGLATVVISTLGDGGQRRLTDALLLGRTEKATSLTGRVPLWEDLASHAAERPLTGHGYETFWTADRIDEVMKSQNWAIQSAHNGYFEVALQLGMIGLTLALGFVLCGANLLQVAHKRRPMAGYAFAYGVIAFALANSLLESHFAKLKYPTVIALIAVLGAACFFPRAMPSEEADRRCAWPNAEGDARPARKRRCATEPGVSRERRSA